MKARIGKLSRWTSRMILIATILCLGLSTIPPVHAVHPWVSTQVTSPSTRTSRRQFSTRDPLAVLPASSKNKKSPKEDEEKIPETTPLKRRSFFGRPTKPKEDETETTAEPLKPKDTPKGNGKDKKSSWKEVRKPKDDENSKKNKRRFWFGKKTSKQSESSSGKEEKIETTPKRDESSKEHQEPKQGDEKPKRKSRFQRAKESRQGRQPENELTASNTTETDDNSSLNATATDEANESSTISNNSTSASNTTTTTTTMTPFGVPPPQPIIYHHRPYPARPAGGIAIDGPGGPSSMPSNTALVVTAIVSVLGVVSRLWLVLFITNKLASDAEELLPPVQHFVWECLNDKFSKDARIFGKALSQPPLGYTKRQWKKYLKQEKQQHKKQRKEEEKEASLLQQAQDAMDATSTQEESNLQAVVTATKKVENAIQSVLGMGSPKLPKQTTIVVDLTPRGEPLNLLYLSDVVNLLIQVHASNNHNKHLDTRIAPMETEVVLLMRSPGGEVSMYGLAAAQVARLENAGIRTTICVDHIAASGGYMIASQTSQILAAPFAMVGSIGVMQEGLNVNKLLEKYGVKPLVLKAGEHKHPLSTFGPVTDKDVKEVTKQMEEIHEAFIELCTSRRPSLDPAICDGTVLLASRALESGLVDRILTSDEYLWERICAGDHVLKLHRTMRTDQRRIFARALDLLPHLKERIQGMNIEKVVRHLVQGYAVFSMFRKQFSPTP